MANQQKAVFVREVGQPAELGTREVPSPGEGQVLVKVTATMILPHDSYGRDWGLFIGEKLPYVLGSNVAGQVSKLGAGVTSLKLGDRVFGLSNYLSDVPHQAGLQQYAILDVAALAKAPNGLTDYQVVTLPVNVVTSFMALYTKFGFDFPPPFAGNKKSSDYQSQSIVIVAAGSNCGKFAVQLAKIAGIGKIFAIAGASNKDQLLKNGATHFIDRTASIEEVVSQIHSIVGRQGVTHMYDCYGAGLDLAMALLSIEKPSILTTLQPLMGDAPDTLKKERPLCEAKFVECSNENLGSYAADFWAHLPGWVEGGKVMPADFRVIEGLEKVDEINAALDDYRDVKRGPQAVVHP